MRRNVRTRRSRTIRGLVAAALTLLIVAAGCGGGDDGAGAPRPTGEQANDQELVDGHMIFTRDCATCHGSAGGGGVGPQLSEGTVAERLTLEEQIAVITDGRGQMPSWEGELSEREIRAVARYEREVL